MSNEPKEPLPKEQQELNAWLTLHSEIIAFINLRASRVPLYSTLCKGGIEIIIDFKNTKMHMKTTNINEAYKEATQFICEMVEQYENNSMFNPINTSTTKISIGSSVYNKEL